MSASIGLIRLPLAQTAKQWFAPDDLGYATVRHGIQPFHGVPQLVSDGLQAVTLATDSRIVLPDGMSAVAPEGTTAVVVTRDGCPFCVKTKTWLDAHSVKYAAVELGEPDYDTTIRKAFLESIGQRTFPQIFIEGVRIGGYDDLIGSEFAKSMDMATGMEDEDF